MKVIDQFQVDRSPFAYTQSCSECQLPNFLGDTLVEFTTEAGKFCLCLDCLDRAMKLILSRPQRWQNYMSGSGCDPVVD